ncbi:MAG TPA: hypothetical protein VFE13_01680, partial [Caulobacteraceae bacterium]|nr:hypothetical protein [Caulobacteraceae bacterium]
MPEAALIAARDAPAPGGVFRMARADARQALERFESSSMVEDGAVCLLALDAVRARLGARWEARRQQVYDHAEQTLRR